MIDKKSDELELYIHIPFCVKKCAYCDFLSFPMDEDSRNRYVEALLTEIVNRASSCDAYSVVSVFLGGGTPSVLEGECIEKIFRTIRDNYQIREDAEITIECNPGTIDEKKLLSYKIAGINRISIGLQSTHEEELKILGRIHDYKDFLEAYRLVREAGFSNVNVDLMSGIPGSSWDKMEQSLKQIVDLKPAPEHLSVYSLIVEEGTLLEKRIRDGALVCISEEQDREIYHKTVAFLQNYGYQSYEVSNYAREGYACIHNIGYWRRRDYLGFGIGAASLMKERRFQNASDIKHYIERPLECRIEETDLSLEEQIEEYIFLGLRLRRGISLQDFENTFHKDFLSMFSDSIEKHQKNGLLVLDEKKERMYLTEKGFDLADYVTRDFI